MQQNCLFVPLIFVVILGCGNPRYKYAKQSRIESYYARDPIVIADFIFCNNIVGPWDRIKDLPYYMNEDSVLTIFERSLMKLNQPISLDKRGANLCTPTLRRRWLKKLDESSIHRIVQSAVDSNLVYLFPVITFTHGYIGGMHYTSSGGVGGSRYSMDNILNIDLIIIKKGKIVYQRSGVKLGSPYPGYEIMEIQHTLTQQDWDELVALVMKDYVDRLQEGTEMNKLD